MVLKDTKLDRKFSPRAVVMSALGLLIVGIAVAFYNGNQYRVEKERELDIQAQILAASVTAAVAFDDMKTAQEYVSALSINPELDSAAVYDLKGSPLGGFFRNGSMLPSEPPLQRAHFQNGYVTVVSPVAENGSVLGRVYLRTSPEPLEQIVTRFGGVVLLSFMGALVLFVLGAAQASVIKANAELENQARDLAKLNQKLQAEIAERKKAEDALRQSQKMEAIGQLSGGIAHDFNNLLAIIKGNLQLLKRRMDASRTDLLRYVDSAMEGISRATTLTQRILAFSRRQPLSPAAVNLSRLVEDMDVFLRHSVGDKIAMAISLEARGWTMCDINQMENVILNLAINARDAMPQGGTLTVQTRDRHVAQMLAFFDDVPPGDYVELTVSDNGVGMSEEVRSRALDPFFTTKPLGQGTGLGLSMTFGYIRQSNGYLNIESEPGKGTTVTILMPRYEADARTDKEDSHGNQRRA